VKVWYRHPVSRWLQHWNPRHRAIFELERRLYQPSGVRRIIVQSKLDAKLLTEYFGVNEDRIRPIMNGVDTRTFHPGVRQERTTVRDELSQQFAGAVRRIDNQTPLIAFASMDFRRKGLDSLLMALARLKNKDAMLLVLGAGDTSAYQKKA